MEVNTIFMCPVVVFRRRELLGDILRVFVGRLRLISHALVVTPPWIKGIEIKCFQKIIHSFLNCFIVVLDRNN